MKLFCEHLNHYQLHSKFCIDSSVSAQDDDSALLLLRHRLCRGDRLQSESSSSRVGDAVRDLDKIIVMWNSDDYDHLNTSE